MCVDDCDGVYRYLYESKCYENCPPGTSSKDFICEKNSTNITESNIRSIFLEHNLTNFTLDTNEKKQKFIESTSKAILNSDLNDLLLQATLNKKIFTRKFKNETYQIYSLSNKKRVDQITYIDFNNCEKILREKHQLSKEEDLIIFKIEYDYPGIKIPIIEYQIFNKNGKKKLNLNHCKNAKILYYIPREINNYIEYKYNPEHKYYNEKCFQTDEDYSTDLVLYDRKNEFNKNNMSLCESLCTFKGYINKNIICECEVKLIFNSFLNDNSNKYNLIYRFDIIKSNEKNFWTVNCFLNRKIEFSLLFNFSSIFNLIIIIYTN